MQYFLPLASVDLSKLNPEWVDTVHFIVPIEPADGVVGETTQEFHTYYSKDNWVGFRNSAGRYEYEGDWRLFVKDTIPEYYEAALEGYEAAKQHFEQHHALHMPLREPNENGEMFDLDRPRPLARQLGGECHDANWANMGNFEIARFGSWSDPEEPEPRERQKVRPVTEDGRPFEYVGCVETDHFNMNHETRFTWADAHLFYDPQSRMTLITFDWS